MSDPYRTPDVSSFGPRIEKLEKQFRDEVTRREPVSWRMAVRAFFVLACAGVLLLVSAAALEAAQPPVKHQVDLACLKALPLEKAAEWCKVNDQRDFTAIFVLGFFFSITGTIGSLVFRSVQLEQDKE